MTGSTTPSMPETATMHSSHHSDDRHGGCKKEGRGDSASRRKKHKPPHRSPSPPPSKGGRGGGGRRRSCTPERGIRHPDDEDYDNQYFGPKCFMDRIREKSIPKGINTKLPGDNMPYDGSGQLEIWIDDFFNVVRAVGGSTIVACLLLQNYLTGPT